MSLPCYVLRMEKIWIVVGMVALYFALQLWILPAFGIST